MTISVRSVMEIRSTAIFGYALRKSAVVEFADKAKFFVFVGDATRLLASIWLSAFPLLSSSPHYRPESETLKFRSLPPDA